MDHDDNDMVITRYDVICFCQWLDTVEYINGLKEGDKTLKTFSCREQIVQFSEGIPLVVPLPSSLLPILSVDG